MKNPSRPMLNLLAHIQQLTITGDGCTVVKTSTFRALATRCLVSGKRWGNWGGWNGGYVYNVRLTDKGRKALEEAAR